MHSDRLAAFSQRMSAITLAFIVGMLMLNAASWFFPVVTINGMSFALTDQSVSGLGIDAAKLPWWQKAGATLLSSVPLLVLAYGLEHLRRLFRAYGRREYFSLAAGAHLGKLARAIGLWVLANLLCQPLLSMWLTVLRPAGHHMVTLSFGSPDIVALFLAASVAVIARILRQASELHAEHRLFV